MRTYKMAEGLLTDNGRKPATYELLSSSPLSPVPDDDDDNSKATVAGLFADPPGWLVTQLGVYRKDPQKHIKPLCAAVAAVVLEDGARGDEVREEVERILKEGVQS
jgi:hypothetical protein